MNRTQQAGLILLLVHILCHFTGLYRVMTQPTYDVYVSTGQKGFVLHSVSVDQANIGVLADSAGTLVLYGGRLGERIELPGVKDCGIVAVRKPLFFSWQ